MTYKKSALLVYNYYELQPINLDIIYEHSECSKETGHF